eukprot:3653974-Amphidinium_carterae.1
MAPSLLQLSLNAAKVRHIQGLVNGRGAPADVAKVAERESFPDLLPQRGSNVDRSAIPQKYPVRGRANLLLGQGKKLQDTLLGSPVRVCMSHTEPFWQWTCGMRPCCGAFDNHL